MILYKASEANGLSNSLLYRHVPDVGQTRRKHRINRD